MTISRIVILVEGESDEPVVSSLVHQVAPQVELSVVTFAGRPDLLRKLPKRLLGFKYLGAGQDLGVVVLIDRDDDDCRQLLSELEQMAESAGLPTLANHRQSKPAVVNRIAVEEVESWMLGDIEAVVTAYPRVSRSIADKAGLRDPDAVKGGTAEALARVLRGAGYMRNGLNKREAALAIAPHLRPDRNRSLSCRKFCEGVVRLIEQHESMESEPT